MHNYNRVDKITASLEKMRSSISSTLEDVKKFEPDQARDDHGRFSSGGGTTTASKDAHQELLDRHDRATQNLKDNGKDLHASAMGIIRESLVAGKKAESEGDVAHSLGDHHIAGDKHAEAVNHYNNAEFGYNHIANAYAQAGDRATLSSETAAHYDHANSLMNLESLADNMATDVGSKIQYDWRHDSELVSKIVDMILGEREMAARLDRNAALSKYSPDQARESDGRFGSGSPDAAGVLFAAFDNYKVSDADWQRHNKKIEQDRNKDKNRSKYSYPPSGKISNKEWKKAWKKMQEKHSGSDARMETPTRLLADLLITKSEIPDENIAWLNSQIQQGGHSAEVAKEIIASLMNETEKSKKIPQYSLPEEMRARKHVFYPHPEEEEA